MKPMPWFAFSSVLAALTSASLAQTSIGFEQPDYPTGTLSNTSWTGPAVKTVTNDAASEGSQSLAISGSNQRAEYTFNMAEAAAPSVVSFDFQPSAYLPPDDINFQNYGTAWVVANNDSLANSGVRFILEDWDSFPWDPAPPSAFKVMMVMGGPATEAQVGTFSPGTWYRYEATIDWANNQYTQTLSVLGGSVVATRSHAFTATGVTSLRFYTPQITYSTSVAYIDRIIHGAAPPPSGYGPWSLDPTRFTPQQIAAGDHQRDRDPDADGRVNLVEYALDGNPNVSDPGISPHGGMAAGNLTFDFVIPSARSDLTYITESCNNLTGWSPVRTDPGSSPGPIHVTIPASGSREFIRLRIVSGP